MSLLTKKDKRKLKNYLTTLAGGAVSYTAYQSNIQGILIGIGLTQTVLIMNFTLGKILDWR